ncbi:MAG: hypothetical protein H0U60_12335 [Blastocatellia bacterium]|nr:hypothetical protein [Blastocatellia bacterium]
MPLDGSAGYGKGTERKQRDMRDYQWFHWQLWLKVTANNDWASPTYHYVDLNGGPGEVNGIVGSPILVAQTMAESGSDWHACVCERDPESMERLRSCKAALPAVVAARIRLFAMDHQEAGDGIIKAIHNRRAGRTPLGLIYADPNGTELNEEIETALKITKAFPRMDVLLHMSATTIKRCRTVFGRPSFVERLEVLKKRHLLIREPCTAHQWTFALLTNWAGFPDWASHGFHSSTSPTGSAVLERLNLTTEERRRKNAPPAQEGLGL